MEARCCVSGTQMKAAWAIQSPHGGQLPWNRKWICSIKPLTCGVCNCNINSPILTNITKKYIDLGQKEAFHSNYHMHVPEEVVLNQGVYLSPSTPQRTFDNVWRHCHLSRLGIREMFYLCLVGRGKECCQISYNMQDSTHNKELSAPWISTVPRLTNPGLRKRAIIFILCRDLLST